MRPCLNHFALQAHRPLIARESDFQLCQFFLRPGLAVDLLSNELPGPLNLLEDVLAGVLSAPALQSRARRERGDDNQQKLATHRSPSRFLAKLMPGAVALTRPPHPRPLSPYRTGR